MERQQGRKQRLPAPPRPLPTCFCSAVCSSLVQEYRGSASRGGNSASLPRLSSRNGASRAAVTCRSRVNSHGEVRHGSSHDTPVERMKNEEFHLKNEASFEWEILIEVMASER